MNGLRVYTNIEKPETCCGRPVFYSRREDGPHYRWLYDDQQGWRAGRVPPGEVSPGMLSNATWKELPDGLQRSMIEHYQD